MNAYRKYLAIQWRMDLRDRGVLRNYYLTPLLFFLIIGAVFSAINPQIAPTMAASMSIFAITVGAIMGTPIPLAKARESGTLRALRVNGVSNVAVLTVPAVSALLHLMIVSAVIFVLSPVLLHGREPSSFLAYLGVLLLFLVATISLGLVIAAVSPTQSTSTMLSMIVLFPTVVLSGIMFPTSMLPSSLAWTSLLFPATHALQAFYGFAYDQPTSIPPILAAVVLGAMSVLFLTVAIWRFTATSRKESL